MDVRERTADARRAIRQAWIRYVVLELVVVVVPIGVALALWAGDVVPGWVVALVAVLAVVAIAVLMYDTVLRRVRPLEREIAQLEALATSSPGTVGGPV